MNKRKFLKMLGIGVVAAPAIPNLVRDITTGKPVIPEKKKVLISETPGPIGVPGPFNASASAFFSPPPNGFDEPFPDGFDVSKYKKPFPDGSGIADMPDQVM